MKELTLVVRAEEDDIEAIREELVGSLEDYRDANRPEDLDWDVLQEANPFQAGLQAAVDLVRPFLVHKPRCNGQIDLYPCGCGLKRIAIELEKQGVR